MTDPKNNDPVLDPENNRICFCHVVSEAAIRKAIREGAHTIEQIQSETQASTGCGGCEPDVRAILEDELAKMSKP